MRTSLTKRGRSTAGAALGRQAARRLLPLALAAALGPRVARGDDLVTEAAFLADTLPPGGLDLNLSVSVAPDGDRPDAALAAEPRVQVAAALGPRLGLTADVGLERDARGRPGVASPAASLKLLLADLAPGRTGLAVSLDAYGDTAEPRASELGVGLGAVRGLGGVTLRAAAWGVTRARAWDPHAHAGLSAAVAAGARVRLLAEFVSDLRAHGSTFAAGPSVKVALGSGTSLAAGALFDLGRSPGVASLLVQVGHAL